MNRNIAVVTAVTILTGSLAMVEATPSEAATPTQIELKAMHIARAKEGAPYSYGATGPSRLHCSGLTYYSYKHAGKSVPRTAQEQFNYVQHIRWQSRKMGDLVAIGTSTHRITHVGIYAGYWSGKSWMINANSGSYRGYKVVDAPIKEYLGGGRHAYYGRPK